MRTPKVRSLSSRLVTAASDMATRARMAMRAGLTFGGRRDLYQTLGYKRDILTADYRDRYQRNGIAARVVEALPKATWRGGVEVIEDDDPELVTPFEEEFGRLAERLKIWSVAQRADVLSGLSHYSIILIGAPGNLDTELPQFGAEQVVYLQPYAEDDARINTYDEDSTSARFGLPQTYVLARTSVNRASNSVALSARIVHWSRVIHVADGNLDDNVFGQPRLERIWNWLDDMEKITGAGAEAFWLRAHQGYHIDIDKDLPLGDTPEAQTEAVEALRQAAQDLSHGFERAVVTRGAKFDVLGSDVANFNPQIDSLVTLISGATGIPKRILMGSERGELSSTQDRENWNERVNDRRHDFAEPYVIRTLVDRLIKHGALPQPDSYRVQWPDIQHLTETERADVAVKWAGLNTAAGDLVVTAPEIRDKILGLPPLEDSQIEAFNAPDPNAPPAPDPNAVPDPVPPDPSAPPQPAARAARGKARPGLTPGLGALSGLFALAAARSRAR